MTMLATLLPILCFLALLRRDDFRESFLVSALATALFVVLSTELLSLLKSIAYVQLVEWWVVFLFALVVWRSRSEQSVTKVERAGITLYHKVLLALLLAVVCLTGITALVAAPNNFDSLTYHLPRIMHWIQNRSVEHYPTHIDRQLVLAPFSEFVMLHLHLLSGSDRFDNCVQWFAMVGSAVGVSLIVRALKGTLNSQILAAAISVSLPMGLLQSTSTQNDYTVTFWLVCLAYYVIKAKECPDAKHALLVGTSLALAILTKGTAYLVALPFMLIYLWFNVARKGAQDAAVNLLVVSLLLLMVNGGHYRRNVETYGNPISPGTGNDIICSSVGLTATVSCVAKNVATQLASGLQGADAALQALTGQLHRALGLEVNDPNLTADRPFMLPARIHEDYAPNPLHMALMLLGGALLVAGRKRYSQETVLFAATAMASFVALSIGIKWNPFISRYFLPVFVISAPFLALLYEGSKLRPLVNCCAALLLLCSFFVLAHNEMRPLVGPRSVFVTERMDQYFMTRPQAKQYFTATANMIKGQPIRTVGILDRDGNMWEYILWLQLQEAGGTYRIEHVEVQNPSGKIELKGFSSYFPVMI